MSRDTTPSQAIFAWTPRQRQVLDLLASGCTNTEIADRLGISLAGAKWHVSEVMSKLGVPSREQAAAFWREEQRLPARVRARFQALLGLAGLKPLGIALGGIVAAVGVAGGLGVYWHAATEADGAAALLAQTAEPPVGTQVASVASVEHDGLRVVIGVVKDEAGWCYLVRNLSVCHFGPSARPMDGASVFGAFSLQLDPDATMLLATTANDVATVEFEIDGTVVRATPQASPDPGVFPWSIVAVALDRPLQTFTTRAYDASGSLLESLSPVPPFVQ